MKNYEVRIDHTIYHRFRVRELSEDEAGEKALTMACSGLGENSKEAEVWYISIEECNNV